MTAMGMVIGQAQKGRIATRLPNSALTKSPNGEQKKLFTLFPPTSMVRAAAVDIGSNALRLIVAESNTTRGYEVIRSCREPVRLGADAFKSHVLSSELMDKTVVALFRFSQILREYAVQNVRVVGTSALRESRNAPQLIERIRRATGLNVDIIAGEEEARLVHRAVAAKVRLMRKTALLIDVGGGSVEVTVAVNGNIIRAESLRLGTVRLLNMVSERSDQSSTIRKLVRAYSRTLRRNLPASLLRFGFQVCIGTGGNLEALGDLRRIILGRSDTSRITTRELGLIIHRLEGLSCAERVARFGLRRDRADVIMPAAYLIQALLAEVEAKEILIPRVGLKDGVLLDLFESTSTSAGLAQLRSRRNQVVAFAEEIGVRYGYDSVHAHQVAMIALQLFDGLKKLHKLDGNDRVMMEVSALLHNIGRYVDHEDHHKHSAYLISETSYVGLDRRQREVVGAICRYHRGAQPSRQHREFASIPVKDRKKVFLQAALLRIAKALDREHGSFVKSVVVQVARNKVVLKVRGQGQLLIEQWAFSGAREMFEKAYGKKVEMVVVRKKRK